MQVLTLGSESGPLALPAERFRQAASKLGKVVRGINEMGRWAEAYHLLPSSPACLTCRPRVGGREGEEGEREGGPCLTCLFVFLQECPCACPRPFPPWRQLEEAARGRAGHGAAKHVLPHPVPPCLAF